MNTAFLMRSAQLSLCLAGGIAAGTAAAAADAVCISCRGPNASYACTLRQDGATVPARSAGLDCVRRIAEAHGHASCAIVRRVPCDGREIVLDIEPSPESEIATTVQPEPPAATPAVPEADIWQRTGDAAKAVGSATRDAAAKAGAAAAEGARRTMDCVGSGFARC